MSNQDAIGDISNMTLNEADLYREDTFTDLRVGVIKRLMPVRADGTTDKQRQVKFLGQTQLMSSVGPLPVTCPIEARNMQEAIRKFPAAIKQAVDEMMEQVKEAQRREASRIVVPGVETTKKIIT